VLGDVSFVSRVPDMRSGVSSAIEAGSMPRAQQAMAHILRERVRRSERVAAVEPVDAELGDTRRGPGLAIAGSGSIREASPALEGAAEVVDG